MRAEVFFKHPELDGRAEHLAENLRMSVSKKIERVDIADVYLSDFNEIDRKSAAEIFSDPVVQHTAFNSPHPNQDMTRNGSTLLKFPTEPELPIRRQLQRKAL